MISDLLPPPEGAELFWGGLYGKAPVFEPNFPTQPSDLLPPYLLPPGRDNGPECYYPRGCSR